MFSSPITQVRPRWVAVALTTAVVLVGSRMWAERAGPAPAPPNYDVRTGQTREATAYVTRFAPPPSADPLAMERIVALADLQRAQPSAQVEINAELGTPEVVGVEPGFGFLTGPATDRAGTMRAFLSAYAGLYGLTPNQIADLVLVADYLNPAGNMSWVEFEQRLNGIPVFQGLIRGGFTAQGELVRTTGPIAAGLDAALLPVSPVLDASHAASAAAATVSVKGTDQTKAWLVYFPIGPGAARLAWATEIWGEPNSFLILVDAADGTLLFRKNLTNYQTQAVTYHVYNDDSPAPMSPSITLPGPGLQAPVIGRSMITLIGNEGPNTFNNLGWMTDGTNLTDGNNVQAGIDRDGVNGVDATVVGSGFRIFDFAFNPGPGNPPPGDDPLTPAYQMGEVTDGFYFANRYHDALYLLGFTEAARNFQNDNFGRGGVALDRISAEFQDSTADFASFTTFPDGGRGRMQMRIFTDPTPNRSSGLDHDVLLHELTHGTSNRLHNNASGLSTTMAMGLGEGWSDVYARALLATADEDPSGIYTFGAWISYQFNGLTDNYYYGSRRFPYAPMTTRGANGKPHNPLTFADISPLQVNLTDGAYPQSPGAFPGFFTPAGIGEVWAVTLLEVRALFLRRMGFAAGNQHFLQLMTDGMKLDPLNPTVLQGRDALLAAAAAGGTAADINDIWTGFAIRGMGVSARFLDPSGAYVFEAYDVPGIKGNGASLVSEAVPNGRIDAGEMLTVSLCMTNTALSTSGSVTGTLMATGGVQSPSSVQNYGTVAPAGSVCRTYSFIVGTQCSSTLTTTLQAQEAGGLTRTFTYDFSIGTHLSENFDGVIAPTLPTGWTTVQLAGTANPWATGLRNVPPSFPNVAFSGAPASISDNALVSPVIAMPPANTVLSFRNAWSFELFFDGSVLEVQINGGAWTDIIAAGGSWVLNGYNGIISGASTDNPLAGRLGWIGAGGYFTTSVNMPASANSQSVRLRWRVGTNSTVASTGWAIDTVSLAVTQCSGIAPVITTHPQSRTVTSGAATTLTVVAAGSATLTYTWYQGVSGDTSNPLGTATSPNLPTGPVVSTTNYWVRVTNAVASADSNTATITIGAGAGANMIVNGNFTAPLSPNWLIFKEPDIIYNVTGGVFQYYRANPTTTASGQATVYQVTGQPMAANAPLRAQFDIGNSSTARKRMSVLAIDSDFSDITICTFWLEPGAPMRTYEMRTHTTKNWSNAALYFYAATKGQDAGFYQLDNVSLQYDPAVSTTRTDCVDPTAPAPAGGAASADLTAGDLIVNGHFQAGGLTSWAQFGSMTWQVVGGVFEFIRPAPLPTPAGVIFQNTGEAMAANDILTATFQLGNSSAVRKRVTVLLQESDFSDLTACTFWLAPFQPLGDYTMRGYATKAWTNATLSIYAASVGPQTWTRIDNVTFQRTPGTAIAGTECVEPGTAMDEIGRIVQATVACGAAIADVRASGSCLAVTLAGRRTTKRAPPSGPLVAVT